jgi:hypothetical protein
MADRHTDPWARDGSGALATRRFLAKTTPTFYVVLVWIGLPVLGSFVAQGLLMSRVASGAGAPRDLDALLPYAPLLAAFLVVWLFGTYWFARRREVLLTPTTFTYPRLLGGHEEYAYSEVASVRATDTMTTVLTLHGGRSHTLRIYDPLEMRAFVEHLGAHVSASAYPAHQAAPPDAAMVTTAKVRKTVGIGFFCAGVVMTALLGYVAVKHVAMVARSVPTTGIVVGSTRRVLKSGKSEYSAVVSYGAPNGLIYQVTSGESRDAPWVVGGRLPVRYDPTSPGHAIVDDFASRWTLPLASLFGPVMCLIGAWEFRASRKRRADG